MNFKERGGAEKMYAWMGGKMGWEGRKDGRGRMELKRVTGYVRLLTINLRPPCNVVFNLKSPLGENQTK